MHKYFDENSRMPVIQVLRWEKDIFSTREKTENTLAAEPEYIKNLKDMQGRVKIVAGFSGFSF